MEPWTKWKYHQCTHSFWLALDLFLFRHAKNVWCASNEVDRSSGGNVWKQIYKFCPLIFPSKVIIFFSCLRFSPGFHQAGIDLWAFNRVEVILAVGGITPISYRSERLRYHSPFWIRNLGKRQENKTNHILFKLPYTSLKIITWQNLFEESEGFEYFDLILKFFLNVNFEQKLIHQSKNTSQHHNNDV